MFCNTSAAYFGPPVTLQAQHKLNFADRILFNLGGKYQGLGMAQHPSRCCCVVFRVSLMGCTLVQNPAIMQPEICAPTLATTDQGQSRRPPTPGNQRQHLKTAKMP